MWYEALPSLVIIGALMTQYQVASRLLSQAFYGNPYRRLTFESWHRQLIDRDIRIAGDAYTQVGLEAIPDEK